MFVSAPKRSTNGFTGTPQVTESFDSPVYYPTFASALSHVDDVSGTWNSGYTAGTYRANMQNGRTGPGTFVNTPYLALYMNHKRESDYVHIHRVASDKYYAVRRQIGFAFDGFGGSGVGSPWLQFEPSGPNGRPSAIANRAIMDNLLNRAEVECLNKARDQKLDLGESLVDIDRTILMIGRRAAQVISAFRHARAGRLEKAAEALGLSKKQITSRGVKGNAKAIAEAWLELQYGWKPLLNDIHDGIQLANEGLERDPYLTTATRRLKDKLPFIERDAFDITWAEEKLTASVEAYVETKYRFRLADANLAYLTGLGLENPAYIAWVALPMSFVVDWFIPVSDWLSAISAPLGLTFVSGYSTVKSAGTIEYERSKMFSHPDVTYLRAAKGRTDFVMMRRIVYDSFPIPKLYFRFPFSNWERVASAIALFVASERTFKR
jgi:hypothetical protein